MAAVTTSWTIRIRYTWTTNAHCT